MADKKSSIKKKPYGKLVIFGAVVITLYAVLLMHQGLVNDYFVRGGLYAFLPIAAAFLISYVHGHFTGYFWTMLGIEAKKKEVK
ncbi:MAG: hypothetical protein A2Z47_01490 [Thermodesulfovibrio sp. RBG_19FT_COMBO_42_12]|nr:MAG: hypothetical protein A2Z47_01490 [Thermodesulfovibrio sp. RBG_19FT_COMBO_42_12]